MRSQATGNLLVRELFAAFAVVGGEDAARFIAGNHHFFLNLTMAAAKCASLALGSCAGSSVVSLISRNGVEVGVQLAGMPGRWFIGARRAGRRRAAARGVRAPTTRRATSATRRSSSASASAGWPWPPRRSWPPSSAATRRPRRAHRADGADLRGPLGALHDLRARRDRHPGRDRLAAGRRARRHARRSPRGSCMGTRGARARSAPAWPTSRSNRSAPRSARWPPSSMHASDALLGLRSSNPSLACRGAP